MGRRSVRVDEPDRWIFNRLATAYRSRPPYPGELVDRLSELAIASRGHPATPFDSSPAGCAQGERMRILDLGAGTGHLAIPLAERGAIVSAVEPARAMLDVLRERVTPALASRVLPVHAAAESTGLPAKSYDLVLVADALHWLDPELGGAEAARLLRPSGTVAVVEAAFAPTPFMTELATVMTRANPKAQRRPAGALQQFLAVAMGRAGRAPAVHVERFAQMHDLDDDGLEQLLRSMSHVGPAVGPVHFQELLGEVRRLAEVSGGARLVRDLTLTWSRQLPDRSS